jgi:protein transport protein SEC24
VFQHILPTLGPGALTNRENATSDKKIDSSILGPVTDFYKKLALECSGMQVTGIYANKFSNISFN